ncbi:MAG: phosphoribosylaminoimidazolesuccinocarboxamide synthase [Sphingobacteriales bacterium 39-19]|nr:phosphoribosylaminoimidazolesuccinocarboxamide synthase [Sphingobacteriales bacterium]OJW08236.1 MAG: phosphoribosylaminoimidazolesuccinocarboxamide synthase [Sphingobacteriales bacterium 39-19]
MNQIKFTGQKAFYQGKVRDVYTLTNDILVMWASNRISAFDVILPRYIPYKGQVLNQVAAYMLNACNDICPHWLLETPTAVTSIGKKCEPIKIEIVVRAYLSGHAWRTYRQGKKELCGVPLAAGLKENDRLPYPIITPSTKAAEGHDEDISESEILATKLATAGEWELLKNYALRLFERGSQLAAKQGLILVDTKYEFGLYKNEITLMDEIHTPDSSRYFYADGYSEKQEKGEKQNQLSKEFVREWLIENNFMGQPGQVIPVMNDDWVLTISKKYIELYEKITGLSFLPNLDSDEVIFEKTQQALQKYRD